MRLLLTFLFAICVAKCDAHSRPHAHPAHPTLSINNQLSPTPSFLKLGRNTAIDVTSSWFTSPKETYQGDGVKLTTSQLYTTITPESIEHAKQPPPAPSTLPISSWIPATVPGTVLTSLVNNAIYPDPYYETNLKYIPDINATGPSQYTYWYYSNFTVSNTQSTSNTHYWLHLHGIHYTAQVYLNGQELQAEGESSIQGMFRRHTLDITSALTSGINEFAMLITPPPVLGDASKGGQGGDHQYARNGPVAQFMLGWDWIQATPDRGVGPWDRITVSTTQCLVLQDPYVITTLNDKQDQATWHVWVDIVNVCNFNVTGSIITTITNTSSTHSDDIVVLPNQVLTNVSLTSHIQSNPQLWWPVGYGQQPLYVFTVQVVQQGDDPITSDEHTLQIGVRTVSSRVDTGSGYATGGRIFIVNGVDIFIRGGNWIATDQLLRYTGDAQRYDTEVRMHAEMGLNTIRVWGGGLTERPYFYSAADRWGVLVMQEFWMTGDNNGRWAGSYDWPDNHNLYSECATDVIKMLRQHASLLFWCLGNELDPTSKNPPTDIATSIIHDIETLDRQRWLARSSMSDEFPANDVLAPVDGPYGILSPSSFWTLDIGLLRRTPFNPESGSVGVPPVETMRLMLSEETLADFPKRDATGTSVNPIWNYHLYLPYTTYNPLYPFNPSDSDKLYNLGNPSNIDEYCEQAQLVNVQQYKALMEGHNYYMWTNYTGFIIWKTQNPWTGLRGLMYDWYLSQNGCYYGVRKATEPLHIQLNQLTSLFGTSYSISIINLNTIIKQAQVTLDIYDIYGKSVSTQTWTLDSIPINAITHIPDTLTWPSNAPANSTLFYETTLFIRSPVITYAYNSDYLSDPSQPTNYGQITMLRESNYHVSLNAYAYIHGKNEHNDNLILLDLQHINGSVLAFGINLQVLYEPYDDANRVLPCYYGQNYFHIFPKQPKEVIVTIPSYLSYDVSKLMIRVKGWNVDRMVIPIKPALPQSTISSY